MKREAFLSRVVTLGFSMVLFITCGQALSAEINWYGGEYPPSWDWIISPTEPNVTEVINFSGPTNVYSNTCYGEHGLGVPHLTLDTDAKTVQLWFEYLGPGYCLALWAPVCGVQGEFGPLEAGQWVFYCDGTYPDDWPWPPWPGGDPPPNFWIPFEVAPLPSIRVDTPNGGEVFMAGSHRLVSWTDLRPPEESSGIYLVRYSTDEGQSWSSENYIVIDPNSFNWAVPSVTSDECLIRVADLVDPSVVDISDDSFSMYECAGSFAGDYTLDCYVDFGDFAAFATAWQEGAADMNDLKELAEDWCDCGNPFDPLCDN